MKKVLLVIAHQDFQPVEYGGTKKVLLQASVHVVTASDQPGVATAADTGEQVTVDLALDQVHTAEYDGVFFVGGPGALRHLDNAHSYRIIRSAAALDIPWGAICIAPRILANAGVLKDKKVTGWDGDGELAGILEESAAVYERTPVVADGNLITANGPEAAEAFGQKIVQSLHM